MFIGLAREREKKTFFLFPLWGGNRGMLEIANLGLSEIELICIRGELQVDL